METARLGLVPLPVEAAPPVTLDIVAVAMVMELWPTDMPGVIMLPVAIGESEDMAMVDGMDPSVASIMDDVSMGDGEAVMSPPVIMVVGAVMSVGIVEPLIVVPDML